MILANFLRMDIFTVDKQRHHSLVLVLIAAVDY